MAVGLSQQTNPRAAGKISTPSRASPRGRAPEPVIATCDRLRAKRLKLLRDRGGDDPDARPQYSIIAMLVAGQVSCDSGRLGRGGTENKSVGRCRDQDVSSMAYSDQAVPCPSRARWFECALGHKPSIGWLGVRRHRAVAVDVVRRQFPPIRPSRKRHDDVSNSLVLRRLLLLLDRIDINARCGRMVET